MKQLRFNPLVIEHDAAIGHDAVYVREDEFDVLGSLLNLHEGSTFRNLRVMQGGDHARRGINRPPFHTVEPTNCRVVAINVEPNPWREKMRGSSVLAAWPT